jgi:predicted DNA-binding protein (UPF0251 family)
VQLVLREVKALRVVKVQHLHQQEQPAHREVKVHRVVRVRNQQQAYKALKVLKEVRVQ